MANSSVAILADPAIRAALLQAWSDSRPGPAGGHEEGGFIVEDAAGDFAVIRWPQGLGRAIVIPPHRDCMIHGLPIVASFHTHPNTGLDYAQGPSDTDKRFVRDDPDLKGDLYIGELVISEAMVYLIDPTGRVSEVAVTAHLLA